MEIQDWIRGLGYPESLEEIYNLQSQNRYVDTSNTKMMDIYSDGTLEVLTSSMNTNFNVKFKDLFPVELTSLEFDATSSDVQYFTAEVSFKYTIYTIEV